MNRLPVRALRDIIAKAGLSSSACIEKSELIELARQAQAKIDADERKTSIPVSSRPTKRARRVIDDDEDECEDDDPVSPKRVELMEALRSEHTLKSLRIVLRVPSGFENKDIKVVGYDMVYTPLTTVHHQRLVVFNKNERLYHRHPIHSRLAITLETWVLGFARWKLVEDDGIEARFVPGVEIVPTPPIELGDYVASIAL